MCCFVFKNKWLGWLREEVHEHAQTMDRINREKQQLNEQTNK
jgi:hypothetical protein